MAEKDSFPPCAGDHQNARKTGLQQLGFAQGFWPPPENCDPCRPLRSSRRTISRRYRCSAAMHDYVERRGWTIAIEVKEVGSGASVRELRQKLIEAARRRDIDVVIVWRLDIVLLRKAARILASVPRPPACFFHAETLL